MPEPVPLPYTPIGTPIVDSVKYDNIVFKTVTWKVPEGTDYKGKIVYVHGFCEHSDIYLEFFDKLSQAGYEVFFFDQRGAGETSKGKYMGKTDEFHTFDDLNHMIESQLKIRKDPTEKLFLMGHSMGGGISLNYGISGKHREDIRGIVVSGPLVTVHPKTQPNFLVRALQPVINATFPGLKIDSKIKYDYITSHEGWRKYIELHDTKLIGTVRQFNDMFVRGEKLLDKEHVSQFKDDIPLLVLHGTNDNINNLESTKKFYHHLPQSVDKKFVPVEGARHSLFLESPEYFEPVYGEVLDFLGKH
ncbi:CIC11C00000005941 [Sungouiella intermedia]|uniref:CIC11C00000005941 n=1 Tax=Sungouiella intermedia TaxID=45354 RepID=A0A1L0D1B1_9ASCO|nr:CIC11C00000005941 [[Candida] intermedia]